MNPETLDPLPTRLRQFRFGILLAALLVMLVYEPIIRLFAPQIDALVVRIVLGLVFGGLTISAVYAVSDNRRAPVVAILLGILALTAEWIDIGFLRGGSLLTGHLLTTAFLCYVILVLLRYIFRCDRVDANTVFASLCIYLLLGILWALVYSLLEHVEQGAFSYALVSDARMRFGSGQASLSIYFSFVTMTTLGYGDVVPVSSGARGLATLQAITGQLYLTVLVAWLVGLHVAHSRFDKINTERNPTVHCGTNSIDNPEGTR